MRNRKVDRTERWYIVDRINAAGEVQDGIDGVTSTDDLGAFASVMKRNYMKRGDCFRMNECTTEPLVRLARSARLVRDSQISYVQAFVEGPTTHAHNS